MSALLIALIGTIGITEKGWATFSREPALLHSRTEVTIGTLHHDRKAGRIIFWFRKQETGQPVVWTDDQRCPAAWAAIDAMADIPVRAAPPRNDDLLITMDGVTYTLDAPLGFPEPRGGRISMRTNIDTPLSRWVDSSLKALASCWSADRPVRQPRK